MNSAGRRCALLCHSGPGWQRHTNTQRASCTLAPSSLVSSALQRHYCCSGSTLSRQCCLFCGPWHRWLVCLASPAFSAILLRPHVKPLIKLIKKNGENRYFLLFVPRLLFCILYSSFPRLRHTVFQSTQ